MSRVQFIAFARAEKLAVGYDANCDLATLAKLLAEALPAGQAGTLSPLLPDLIGEAFVINVCHDSGTVDIERWRNALGWPVLQSLLRCAQDFGNHDNDFPLPQLTDWCRTICTDEDALAELDQLIPIDSVALRALNLQVAEYRSHGSPTDGDANPARRAHQLIDPAL